MTTAHPPENDSQTGSPSKNCGYYGYSRPEIQNLVPAEARQILDIGCGAGLLGKALKARNECYVAGIECVHQAAQAAAQFLDQVYEGDAQAIIKTLEPDSFDVVIMADFLEHVVDTRGMLSEARRVLKPEGRLILSVPNIRHWSVLKDLLEGHFNYVEAGILDQTHLRFFTRESISLALSEAGFAIEAISGTAIADITVPKPFIAACLELGLDAHSLELEGQVYQFLISARPAAPAKVQQPQTPDLTSIIILTWNQLEYTRLCLESIEAHTDVAYELILVDNGSSDGTVDYLKAFAAERDNVRLILNETNRGFAAGNNQGLSLARGDKILFLNNDTVVSAGWLRRLSAHLAENPEIGFVGPVTNCIIGPQQLAAVPYGQNLEAMQHFAKQLASDAPHELTAVLRPVGFCLLARRELIELIGGFDEHYAAGNYEDDDLCLRALLAGFTNYFCQDVFIHHFGSKTFEGNRLNYSAQLFENRARFAAKWPQVVSLWERDGSYGYEVSFTRPVRAAILNAWGEAAFEEGDSQRATRLFERILKLDGAEARALNNLGAIRWQAGDAAAAIDFFVKALATNPAYLDAFENLTGALSATDLKPAIPAELLAQLRANFGDRPGLSQV